MHHPPGNCPIGDSDARNPGYIWQSTIHSQPGINVLIESSTGPLPNLRCTSTAARWEQQGVGAESPRHEGHRHPIRYHKLNRLVWMVRLKMQGDTLSCFFVAHKLRWRPSFWLKDRFAEVVFGQRPGGRCISDYRGHAILSRNSLYFQVLLLPFSRSACCITQKNVYA